MKPHRLRMTHSLLSSYGLYKKMQVYKPHPAHYQEITQFHAEDYTDFLRRVTPDNEKEFLTQLGKFNLGIYTDCPIFSGLYNFCQLYTGASIDGACKLNNGQVDIAINWSGGLHHAKKSEASGFCYINDIVLAILELLKYHARVLYIDIDIHHGDGVEEAFYTTDRVMTVSFHKYGDFFPGSGAVGDVGDQKGKYYSVNFPLEDGIDDKNFLAVFKPVISKIMEVFRPGAIVLQCGADSLTGDRLGCFNVTLRGHGECVRYMKSYGLPLLVLGGGGYNIRNVSRCWTYETSVILDTEVSDYIPYNEFFHYYGPDFKLHLQERDMENRNTREQLEKYKQKVFENLSYLEHAPSVQMQRVPPDYFAESDSDGGDPDVRLVKDEKRREHEAEFYESNKDQDSSSAYTAISEDEKRVRQPMPKSSPSNGKQGWGSESKNAPGSESPQSGSQSPFSAGGGSSFGGSGVVVPMVPTPATPESDSNATHASMSTSRPQASQENDRDNLGTLSKQHSSMDIERTQ